ncbi:hypothetical protein V8F06_001958 [Rhypophila decipiens]
MSSTETSEARLEPAKEKLTFMSLPTEVQNDIVSHCPQNDLICLSLVSKHFHELASVQLYRNFHIVFPDEDDPAYDTPIDGLAGGLDTLATSDYNYAKHLRDISLDTHSAGDKAELAYKPYLYSVSCGKFMNTLLLLALRKARSLETFRWNIRVELSRPLYKALHEIETLSHLHIRMQAGPSLYETPPPLPYTFSQLSVSPPSVHSLGTSYTPPPPIFSIPPPPSAFYVPTTGAPPPPLPKPITRAKPVKRSPLAKEPPTISGFKKLKSLAVLDIDNLEVIQELKECVQNSSGTLTKVKLSFSDALAMQARKPPPDIDPDDSDPDDEFQAVPVPPPGQGYHDDVSGPAKAFRAQEERKSQEAVLGRIFDVESSVPKKSQRKSREKESETKEEGAANLDLDFINSLKALVNRGHDGDVGPEIPQEMLDTLLAAARKVLANEQVKTKSALEEAEKDTPAPTSVPGTSTDKTETKTNPAEEPSEPGNAAVSLFDLPSPTKSKESQKDVNPEDIDIEEPEEPLESQDQPGGDASAVEPPTVATSEASSSVEPPSVGKIAQLANRGLHLLQKLSTDQASANQAFKDVHDKKDANGKLRTLSAEEFHEKAGCLYEANVMVAQTKVELTFVQELLVTEPQGRKIDEYLRSTRGIALKSLSVYLIPVKASVLSRAIDLRVLRRLTLLNVGPQAPIWLHLQRENKESPLPLRKISTDNVSMVFLNFVSQLEELHELFMLERDNKYKPESFAPKTTTTMDQIRRIVLKKHMPTLKRLMIKNIADTAWDVNDKTIMLMCKRGRNLEELACSMGIRAIHTFMQHLAGLVSLRALHIVRLRNDDTCVWVMRETKRFLIDNVSHHPELKLEWVSVDDDDRVERLIRPSALSKKEKKTKKSKGKQKAVTSLGGNFTSSGGIGGDAFPLFPPPDSWDLSSESEDDEDLNETKLETMENIHFYDVWGVRIFKKEVVTGRL